MTTNTTYSIEDGHGNLIRELLPLNSAHAIAQHHADERGESVWLYVAPSGESEEVATRWPWALLDVRSECGYGRILSRHADHTTAFAAFDAEVERQLGKPRSAVTRDAAAHLMWVVSAVAGAVGARVRL